MERQENCEECNSRFQLWINELVHFFDKRTKLLTKDEAFNDSTYGKCMTREQYVSRKQVNINAMIREKVGNATFNDTDFEKYCLVLPFNRTEEECAEDIFKPFRKTGYEIVKISDKIEVLNRTDVYLMSWKKNSNKILDISTGK